ncbi:MAG: outer membrane beta-barrel protein, partial [Agriterribacter sp.]
TIHRFQLSYTASYTKLISDQALFFNNNRNSIEQVREPVTDGVFRNTWKNIGSNRRLGLSASLTWKPSAAFNIGGTLTTQYVWLNSGSMNIRNEGLMKQLVLRSTYTFPKGYSIYFYGFFDGSTLSLQGKRTGWKYYSMTLSKKWKEDRFELNLRMDAFLTRYTWITEHIAVGDFNQSLRTRYQNQNFRLTFSWKIGRKDVKHVQARQAEEE